MYMKVCCVTCLSVSPDDPHSVPPNMQESHSARPRTCPESASSESIFTEIIGYEYFSLLILAVN